MIQISQVNKQFNGPTGPVHVLRDLTLDVPKGEFIAICGPSGSGKSTLLLVLGSLLRPDTGRVLVNEQSLYDLTSEQRAAFRARHLGFVFQQYHLLPYLSVRDNVTAPSIGFKGEQADPRQRAETLLTDLGMQDRLDHFPPTLSAGEKQRTALARAMFHKPAVLLADEPTGNLDETNAKVVLEQLTAFAEAGGIVVLVTHDRDAAAFANRTYTMEAGQLA